MPAIENSLLDMIHSYLVTNIYPKIEQQETNFNDKLTEYETKATDGLGIKLTAIKNEYQNSIKEDLRKEITENFMEEIEQHVENLMYNKLIQVDRLYADKLKVRLLETNHSETLEHLTQITQSLSDIYIDNSNFKDTAVNNLSSYINDNYNVTADRNAIQTTIIDIQNTINSINIESSTLGNLNNDVITQHITQSFAECLNQLKNITEQIDNKDYSVDIPLLINNLKERQENLFRIVISRLTAMNGTLESFKESTAGKINELTTQLEEYTLFVSDEMRSQFSNDKIHTLGNYNVTGDDVVKTTIEEIKKKKIERHFEIKIQNYDDLNKIQISFDNNILKFIFNFDNVNNELENVLLQYITIDALNNSVISKRSVKDIDGIKTHQLDSVLSGEITLMNFIYIIMSKKISSYKDEENDTGLKFDSVFHLFIEHNDNSKSRFEVFNMDKLDITDNTVTLNLKVNKIDTTNFEKMVKKTMISSEFIENKVSESYNQVNIKDFKILFYAFQSQGEDPFTSIFKSEYSFLLDEIFLSLDNNTIINTFISTTFPSITNNIIISNDLFNVISNDLDISGIDLSSYSIELQDLIKTTFQNISSTELNEAGKNISKAIFVILMSLVITHLKGYTISFDINRKLYTTSTIKIEKGGKITLNRSELESNSILLNTSFVLKIEENNNNNDNHLLSSYINNLYYILELKETDSTIELIITNEVDKKTSLKTTLIETTQNSVYDVNFYNNPVVKVEEDDIIDYIAYIKGVSNYKNPLIEYCLIEFNEQNVTNLSTSQIQNFEIENYKL